jgi:hypothetical protein
MTVIAIPAVLKEKFGEAASEALVGLFAQVEESAKDRTIEIVEERFERRLAELEARLIKWMFIFWIGQFASIVGVLTAILFAFFHR